MFITFEGIEGSGKSTQIQKLFEYITQQQNKSGICTKEPGGTPFGAKLRELLLNPDSIPITPKAELLLFTADRIQHIETLIKPALKDQKIVLCDRYIDSTLAYQVKGRNNDPELVKMVTNIIGLLPDLTFLLDISPEKGLARAAQRSKPDRFEKETLAFHHAVRQEYLNIQKKSSNRIHLITVDDLDPEQVFEQIKSIYFSF